MQAKVGAWAAIILHEKIVILKEIATNTTHNQMELVAVIKAIDHVLIESIAFDRLVIYSDSQYVVNIKSRLTRLKEKDFLTKAGRSIPNQTKVRHLIRLLEKYPIDLIKVAAHQKQTQNQNYNREVDKLVRQLLREHIRKIKL